MDARVQTVWEECGACERKGISVPVCDLNVAVVIRLDHPSPAVRREICEAGARDKYVAGFIGGRKTRKFFRVHVGHNAVAHPKRREISQVDCTCRLGHHGHRRVAKAASLLQAASIAPVRDVSRLVWIQLKWNHVRPLIWIPRSVSIAKDDIRDDQLAKAHTKYGDQPASIEHPRVGRVTVDSGGPAEQRDRLIDLDHGTRLEEDGHRRRGVDVEHREE